MNLTGPSTHRRTEEGFTLVELLVSVTLIGLLMVFLLGVTSSTQRLWRDGRAKSSQFREARAAFEEMTRQISQATLNPYWDYDNPQLPTTYIRQSDLHFVSGPASPLLVADTAKPTTPTHAIFFQAPLGIVEQTTSQGLDHLMNAWGYYIKYDTDLKNRPAFLSDGTRIPGRVRYRLMEFRQPSEEFQVFALNLRLSTSKLNTDYYQWFSNSTEPDNDSHPLAENVVALIISPRVSLPLLNGAPDPAEYTQIAPNYSYDSREFQWTTASSTRTASTSNQLPPSVMVTMVAIDEGSALQLDVSGQAANLVDPTLFQNVANYAADLNSLQTRLTQLHVNYRTFTSNITLRNSKWSQ